MASSAINSPRFIPSGTGKSGKKFSPKVSCKLQRLAISTVFVKASGMSANKASISSVLRKYC